MQQATPRQRPARSGHVASVLSRRGAGIPAPLLAFSSKSNHPFGRVDGKVRYSTIALGAKERIPRAEGLRWREVPNSRIGSTPFEAGARRALASPLRSCWL